MAFCVSLATAGPFLFMTAACRSVVERSHPEPLAVGEPEVEGIHGMSPIGEGIAARDGLWACPSCFMNRCPISFDCAAAV